MCVLTSFPFWEALSAAKSASVASVCVYLSHSHIRDEVFHKPHLRYIAWILAKPSLIQINYKSLDSMKFKFVVFDALLVEKLNFEVMFSVVVAMKTVRVMIPVQK